MYAHIMEQGETAIGVGEKARLNAGRSVFQDEELLCLALKDSKAAGEEFRDSSPQATRHFHAEVRSVDRELSHLGQSQKSPSPKRGSKLTVRPNFAVGHPRPQV